LSAWRRNEALALDGAMKLECTTAQLKWSLSASMAHEAERTRVQCKDGRAGGGAMEFAASTAALQIMECAPSTVRLETDLATSMAQLETERAPSTVRQLIERATWTARQSTEHATSMARQ
jgi:hypothetical protein